MSFSAFTAPLTALTEAAARALNVSRVFGEPIQAGATTIVPVATVFGGHGVGFGEGGADLTADLGLGDDDDPVLPSDAGDDDLLDVELDGLEGVEGGGGGGGFGVFGWASGSYVTENGKTTWRPAIDANLLIVGTAAVALGVVAAVASVSAIRAMTGGAVRMAETAGTTATALGAQATQAWGLGVGAAAGTAESAIEAAADTATGIATATSAGFASVAGSVAGAFGGAARRATEFATRGAELASAATLELGALGAKTVGDLGGLGAKAVGETVAATERAVGTLAQREGRGRQGGKRRGV